MDQVLEHVLRLVSEGRLTADEAGPILDAIGAADGRRTEAPDHAGEAPTGASSPRIARLEVREGGRRVVDLRIPVSLGTLAMGRVPGLSAQRLGEIEAAVASGTRGPILDVEDADGDGVRIVLE